MYLVAKSSSYLVYVVVTLTAKEKCSSSYKFKPYTPPDWSAMYCNERGLQSQNKVVEEGTEVDLFEDRVILPRNLHAVFLRDVSGIAFL